MDRIEAPGEARKSYTMPRLANIGTRMVQEWMDRMSAIYERGGRFDRAACAWEEAGRLYAGLAKLTGYPASPEDARRAGPGRKDAGMCELRREISGIIKGCVRLEREERHDSDMPADGMATDRVTITLVFVDPDTEERTVLGEPVVIEQITEA